MAGWYLFVGSLGFAVVMLLTAAGLIVRRWWDERMLATRVAAEEAATPLLARMLMGEDIDAEMAVLPQAAQRAAVARLSQFLRGEERAKIAAYASRQGLFARALRQVTARRAVMRISAIREVELAFDATTEAALRDRLTNDRSIAVRQEAATALMRAHALPPLTEVVDKLGLYQRVPTRQDRALLMSISEVAGQESVALLRAELPPALRSALVEALGASRAEGAADEIARAGASEAVDLRCSALRAAAAAGDRTAGRWVLPRLADPHWAVRAAAARTAGTLMLLDAIPLLDALADDHNWWVRSRALQSRLLLGPVPSQRVRA